MTYPIVAKVLADLKGGAAPPPAEPNVEPLYTSVKGATEITGLSPVTIYRLIAAEKLMARKSGAKTLVEIASVKAYLASLPRFVGTTGQKAA